MLFFVLSDNYDQGLDCEEYETEAQMIEALLAREKLGDTIARVDTVIDGEEVTTAVLDMVKEKRR